MKQKTNFSVQNENGKEPIQNGVFLMAEDNPRDAELFSEMLSMASDGRFNIVCVDSFQDTISALDSNNYAALILDFNLPGTQGIDNIKHISSLRPEIPIVILTGLDDQTIATQSIQLGVQDFISKNDINPQLFLRALSNAVERKNIELTLKKAFKESISRNKKLEEKTNHDLLTNLPNRASFYETIQKAIARAKRMDLRFAVLYFDIDKFKVINDSFGHAVGDQVLQTIGDRLFQALRKEDSIARISGDEFVVLIEQLEDNVLAYSVAQEIYNCINQTMRIGHVTLNLTVSIGIATYPESNTVDNLFQHADAAMYHAKKNDNHFIHFFTPKLEKLYLRQLLIEQAMPDGIANNEFSVVFQPIIDMKNKSSNGIEALLRWNEPKNNIVISPDEFIPIAERSHIINQLSDLVLKEIAMLLNTLKYRNIFLNKVAINISAKQFHNSEFSEHFLKLCSSFNIPLSLLCIEITERQIINNITLCRAQLEEFKSCGMKIALDDYGTGFSSITHLKQLPIDFIKIDKSLISNLDNEPKNLALTAGIIEMAHRMDMRIIGEGVERQEEVDILEEIGCDYIQGFLYSHAICTTDLISYYSK